MSPNHIGGSRSLPQAAAPAIAQVLASLPAPFHVGCARGADALVISACLAAGYPLRVFAIGDQSGAGFWSGSALPVVHQAATAGAPVAWLAGGHLQIPLRARLIRRSLAALAGCQRAVFFLVAPASPGSLRVAAAAVRARVQVVAVPCGFSCPPAPLAGCAGAWQPTILAGLPAYTWQPAQTKFF